MAISAIRGFIPIVAKPAVDPTQCTIDNKAMLKRIGTTTVVALAAILLSAVFFQNLLFIMIMTFVPTAFLLIELVRASRKANELAVEQFQKQETPSDAVMDHIRKNIRSARLLVNKHGDINKRNQNGATVLHGIEDPKIAKILTDGGGDITLRTEEGKQMTALEDAIKHKRANIVKVFLNSKQGSRVYHSDHNGIWKRVKDKETVRLLHEHKYLINPASPSLKNPLLFAAKKGRQEVIKEFIALKKADLKAADSEGRTALHLTPSSKIAEILISTGKMDINAKDKDGHTPLTYHLRLAPAEPKIDHLGVAEQLIRFGANVKEKIENTPLLSYAIDKGYVRKYRRIVNAMIARKPDFEEKDDKGETALALAQRKVKEGHKEYQELVNVLEKSAKKK